MAAKTHSVQVPVSSGEYKKLRQDATQSGMTTRELAKHRLMNGSPSSTPSTAMAVSPPSSGTSSAPVITSLPERGVTNVYIENATLHLPNDARILAQNVSGLE
jgi:hypothetical protein